MATLQESIDVEAAPGVASRRWNEFVLRRLIGQAQTPDERLAWSPLDAALTAGTVQFAALSAERTRVTVDLAIDDRAASGEALPFLARRMRLELERYAAFASRRRGTETSTSRRAVA